MLMEAEKVSEISDCCKQTQLVTQIILSLSLLEIPVLRTVVNFLSRYISPILLMLELKWSTKESFCTFMAVCHVV
jgi:hypothetical protein